MLGGGLLRAWSEASPQQSRASPRQTTPTPNTNTRPKPKPRFLKSLTVDERCSYCCPLLECGRVPRMDCPSSSPMLLGGGELPPPKLTIRFYFLPHSLSYLNYRRQYMNNCFCFISIDYDVPSTTLRGSTFFLYPIVHFAALITLPSSGSIRVTKLNG